MRTENIFQQAMPYAEGANKWECSDADYYTVIAKMFLADKDLDFYTLGVYIRLHLLAYYGYNWQKLYEFGNKNFVDKALKKLEETKYIKWDDEQLIML